MTPTLANPAKHSRQPSLPGTCAPARGVGAAQRAVQAVLITLLAWAALLCTGLGGTFGAVSQSLASKLATSAQYLQRQGGTSQALRAVRRDSVAIVAQAQVTEPPPAGTQPSAERAIPTGMSTPPEGPPHSDARPLASIEPALKPRYCAPPGRAPPALA